MDSLKRDPQFIAFKIKLLCLCFLISSACQALSVLDVQILGRVRPVNTPSEEIEAMLSRHLAAKNYNEAIKLLDAELVKDPGNTILLYKKASIYADTEKYRKAILILDKLDKLNPNNADAKKLRGIVEKIIEKLPHNEMSFFQDEAYVSDQHKMWTYSSLNYYRLTNYGKYGAQANYVRKNNTCAHQYIIDTWPVFTEFLTAQMTYGYASKNQTILPNWQYRVEGYFDTPQGYSLSLGQGESETFDQKICFRTGTIGKYQGNYFFWVRPTFFSPLHLNLFEFAMRKYFSDENTFCTLRVNTGTVPDIGDVPPLNQILRVKQKGITLDGQFPFYKIFFKWGVGYTRQQYPTILRRVTDVSAGLLWRF